MFKSCLQVFKNINQNVEKQKYQNIEKTQKPTKEIYLNCILNEPMFNADDKNLVSNSLFHWFQKCIELNKINLFFLFCGRPILILTNRNLIICAFK